jgi:hypothetical protein
MALALACGGDDGGPNETTGGSPAGSAGGAPANGQTGSATGAVGDGAGSGAATTRATGSASGDLDACELVTAEDVTEILGAAPPPPMTDPVGPFATCAYYASLRSFVQFQVCRCLDSDGFDTSAEQGAEFFDIEAKPISGIGEKAYWFEGILWVYQDGVSLNLWISRPDFFSQDGVALEGEAFEAVSLPVTRELAEKVLSRLP